MLVEPYLESIKSDGGLYAYKVQMDSNTVTYADINSYSMPGKIYLQIVQQAEQIPIEFILTPTGANFTDYE